MLSDISILVSDGQPGHNPLLNRGAFRRQDAAENGPIRCHNPLLNRGAFRRKALAPAAADPGHNPLLNRGAFRHELGPGRYWIGMSQSPS